jgi:hypothetical protein
VELRDVAVPSEEGRVLLADVVGARDELVQDGDLGVGVLRGLEGLLERVDRPGSDRWRAQETSPEREGAGVPRAALEHGGDRRERLGEPRGAREEELPDLQIELVPRVAVGAVTTCRERVDRSFDVTHGEGEAGRTLEGVEVLRIELEDAAVEEERTPWVGEDLLLGLGPFDEQRDALFCRGALDAEGPEPPEVGVPCVAAVSAPVGDRGRRDGREHELLELARGHGRAGVVRPGGP